MFPRLYFHLLTYYNFGFVLLAAAICLLTCFVAYLLIKRVKTSKGKAPYIWTIIYAIAVGSGFWTTHFIAMQACPLPYTAHYDLSFTVLSVLLTILACGLGLALTLLKRWRYNRLTGSLVMGGGLALMHVTGLESMTWPEESAYAPLLLGVALTFGAGSVGAAQLALVTHRQGQSVLPGIIGLASGVFLLHFITILPMDGGQNSPLPTGETGDAYKAFLTLAVTVTSLVILSFTLLGIYLDNKIMTIAARETQRLRTLANASMEGLLLIRNGCIIDANQQACTLIGQARKRLKRLPFKALFNFPDHMAERKDLLTVGAQYEAGLTTVGGDVIPVEIRIRTMQTSRHSHLIAVIRDLRNDQAQKHKIRQLSTMDSLTGLINRSYFNIRLDQAIQQAKRSTTKLALLILDIDEFRDTNLLLGLEDGDRLLQEISKRLLSVTLASDTLARLSGDEFAILQEDIDGFTDPEHLVKRLKEAFMLPFTLQGKEIALTHCIGIALYPENGTTAPELMANAINALERAKQEGTNTARFFEAIIDSKIRLRRRLGLDLKKALKRNELLLHYQPLINLDQNQPPHRVRGSVTLETSGTGICPAGYFYPSRRRKRPHYRDWRLGTASGLPRSRLLEGPLAGGDQFVPRSAQGQPTAQPDSLGAGRNRAASFATGAGNHGRRFY
tara:strand:+ start:506 stop:2521 length:2016 start_codon:yes stop_codon:yes gene_type:complete